MADVASPGHKLGQLIGQFFEEFFAVDFAQLCEKHGLYCDRKGKRPGVRGNSTKVTWVDKDENKHDLDYVIEKAGSSEKRGVPVAFIELAWRRYTKHSRNKTGEFEGSLLHLRQSYNSCRFLGVILAGEYTEGGKNQLLADGIAVLHIPFKTLSDCFKSKGVNLDYPENAKPEEKRKVIRQWVKLSKKDIREIQDCLYQAIKTDYSKFKRELESALLRKVISVIVIPLFGTEISFTSIRDAMLGLAKFDESTAKTGQIIKYEVQIRFSDKDKIEATFHGKSETIRFLNSFS